MNGWTNKPIPILISIKETVETIVVLVSIFSVLSKEVDFEGASESPSEVLNLSS